MKYRFILFVFWVTYACGCYQVKVNVPAEKVDESVKTVDKKQKTDNWVKTDNDTGMSDGSKSAWNPEFSDRETSLQTTQESVSSHDKGITVLSGNDELPQEDLRYQYLAVPINSEIRRCIKFYVQKRRPDIENGMRRAQYFIPMIERKLASRGMPQEFVWIPFVESYFDVEAYSRNHAAGLWQLMPIIARKFGLRVDDWIDERKDPLLSTDAALDLLEYLHKKFGDWLLALAAYNVGEGKVFQAIRTRKTKNYWELARTKNLPGQTVFYVSAVFAVDYIARHPEEFDLSFDKTLKSIDDNSLLISISDQISLVVLAQCASVNIEEFYRLNPALKKGWTPPDYPQFQLRVPISSGEIIKSCLDSLKPENRTQWIIHKVKAGDTLYKIAKKYKSSVVEIMKSNGLKNSIIFPGNSLVVPVNLEIP